MPRAAAKQLKSDVKRYWDKHPCGTQFTELSWGSKKFFEDVERLRYSLQPFMDSTMGFSRYRGKKLLEIGCGLGTDLLQFARGGALVTGVDLTPKSVELAKKRFKLYRIPARLRVADAEALPFKDDSFDVVYSFGVLHHTPDTQKAVDEVFRVLKPGGEIIIMLYHRRSLHVLLGAPLYKFLRLIRSSPDSNGSADDWIRIYDGAENPLGKAYSKKEVRKMFSRFRDLRFEVVDPIRRRFPRIINWINQTIAARYLGFYLIIRGKKDHAQELH